MRNTPKLKKLKKYFLKKIKYFVTISETDKQTFQKLMTDLRNRWQIVIDKNPIFLENTGSIGNTTFPPFFLSNKRESTLF
jgi:hypothetical protein